jgi:hypothetical protein
MRMKPTRIDAKVATQFMFHTHLHLKWQCILYVDDGLPFAEVELLETRSCLTMIQSTSCLFVLFISKSLVARCSCWCWFLILTRLRDIQPTFSTKDRYCNFNKLSYRNPGIEEQNMQRSDAFSAGQRSTIWENYRRRSKRERERPKS